MAIQQTLLGLLLGSSVLVLTTALPSPWIDESTYSPSSIIKRDVCVIGGGSSGTYAAIGLRDRGKSVVVVEAQSVLGGHTNTYTDPATNAKVDYGVLEWENTSTVTSYFSRFNIPLAPLPPQAPDPSVQEYYVDFRTGKNVTEYVPTDPTAALGAYAAQLAKYPFLDTSGWDLPNPVPADLLIPFGDFVKKYNLDAAVFLINEFTQGFGDILSIPTLYILKYYGTAVLAGSQTGFITTARRDNGELYEKARAELGADVFLNSKVIVTDRNGNGNVKVLIQTTEGVKLIVAKKLLISIPPLISNLAGFDLSPTEHDLFAQWVNGAYYTALVRNTGIPDNVVVTGVSPGTPYNLPALPALYSITPSGLFGNAGVPGLKDVTFGASSALASDADVKAAIVTGITEFQTANGFTTASHSQPELVAYNSHTPYEMRVSAQAVEAGFYTKLTALQGVRNTYWTGAAFDKHDSTDLWAFTEGLVEKIAA